MFGASQKFRRDTSGIRFATTDGRLRSRFTRRLKPPNAHNRIGAKLALSVAAFLCCWLVFDIEYPVSAHPLARILIGLAIALYVLQS